MPRPLSSTVIEPSVLMTTLISVQNPASASSIELSTTSYTMWWRPRMPVLPIYIAGRSRTGVSPSSTVMWDASYVSFKENLRRRGKYGEIQDVFKGRTVHGAGFLIRHFRNLKKSCQRSVEFADVRFPDPQFPVDRKDEPVERCDHVPGVLFVHRARLVPDHFLAQQG